MLREKETQQNTSKFKLSKKSIALFVTLFSFVSIFFIKVGKAKAIIPAIWLLGAAVAYVGGEAVNYFGLNPLRPEGGVQATATGSGLGQALLWVFNILLYAVLYVFSKFLILAGFILDQVFKPDIFLRIVGSKAVFTGWKIVRDFLNITFILVLLYSAFCTIFQIEKYHIKKIILMIVLMALLVNFSFPIARFIIDTSNVLMYFILNSAFPSSGGEKSAMVAGLTGIGDLINTNITITMSGSYILTAQIIMSIIFLFILMVTLFAVGILLLIRIITLAILVIFSPIGFVAAIFPSTKSFADSWWNQLLKQSFFGPIMAFFIYLAILIMQEQSQGANTGKNALSSSAMGEASFFATALYFLIPIVMLWIGLISAQKIGAMGAGAVVGTAGKFAKWAGKLPWRGAKAGFRATGVPGGVKQGFDHFKKTGKLFGAKIPGYGGSDKREEREAQIGGFIKHRGEGWDAGARNAQQKRVNEQAKENEDLNRSNSDLINRDLVSGDTVKAQAAAKTLIKRDAIDDTDILKKVLAGAGNEADIKRQAIDKLGKKFTHGINDEYELEDLFAEIDKGIAGTPDAKKIKDNLKSKIKDDKNIHLIIDHEVEFDGKTKQQSYADNLSSMDPKDIGKQRKLHERVDSASSKHDPEFSDFINDLSTNDRPSFAKMAGAMNITDKDRYKKEGFLP